MLYKRSKFKLLDYHILKTNKQTNEQKKKTLISHSTVENTLCFNPSSSAKVNLRLHVGRQGRKLFEFHSTP